MGLGREVAIRLSFDGMVVPLASRCSVHCKSDITHKLNRHEATPADILHTLHDSMANKVAALLEKGQCVLRRVLVISGVVLGYHGVRFAAYLGKSRAAQRPMIVSTSASMAARGPRGLAQLARSMPFPPLAVTIEFLQADCPLVFLL